ncbi:MAG: adenylate/guanylate cyclase domain-containing protein [Rhizobiales bacterium]|nr:adenylate/guanylate cyclase domain-containing protein [Hyphomicrobiales bacterium]
MSQIISKPGVAALSDWICAQGLLRADLGTLLEGFCERLAATGLPLARGYLTAQTLHPRIAGLGYAWRPGRKIVSDTYLYQTTPSAAFLVSPIKHLLDTDLADLRVRLQGDEPLAFPVCEDLRAEGCTDYFIQLQKFGRDGAPDGKTGAIFSWTSSEPGGFADDDIALLRLLAPRLAMAVQTRTSQDITVNLLDAYVGSAAGRLILDGDIRRGALEVISSVILLADLQGFTAMSERTRHDDLVDMLNQYFDCLVGPIVERGGNVLKFLGDGLLATFPLNGEPAEYLCEQALDAAADILERVERLKGERAAAGKPVMILDIALHLGDVYWGNVGSAERLDFTVVGPAVNEAARIETLCAQYERNLLVSETFAQAATRSSARLVSIGRFALRGVRSAQSIYTLEGMLDPGESSGRG